MARYLRILLATAVLWMLPSCTDEVEDRPVPILPDTNSGVSVDIILPDGEDPKGIETLLRRCDGTFLGSFYASLQSLPRSGDARQLRLPLEAGCYDIDWRPMKTKNRPSKSCYLQGLKGWKVESGVLKEFTLTAQCSGSLDQVVALNHPPVIEKVEYSPSKFVFECEDVEICVTAFDPNGDPLHFAFEQTGGQRLWLGPKLSSVETLDQNRVRACMRTSSVWNDNYEFKVSVFDMGYRAGDALKMEEITGARSRAEMTFPLYTNWDIELHCYDQHQDTYHRFQGVREIQRVPGCIPIWPFQFYCSSFYWDDVDYTCPGGQFMPERVYPLCEDFPQNHYSPEPVPKGWKTP